MRVPPLDGIGLSKLSDADLEEYLALLEDLRLQDQREDLKAFARGVEIPGVLTKQAGQNKTGLHAVRKAKSDVWRLLNEPGLTARDIETQDEPEPESADLYGDITEPAEHHDLVLDAAQGLLEETLRTPDGQPVDGVMIFMPPGAAKSSYGSVVVPAFALGAYPGTDIIGTSYAQELADRFSRRVRTLCASDKYRKIMDTALTEGNTAVRQWSLANGSSYRAAGIGAAVTGFRADLLVVDDPVAGREEADSQVIRDKTWSGYKDDLVTRLKPGGKILIIQTRWHEDDLSGRILGERWKGQSGHWIGTDNRHWFIINLPMVAEHDDDLLGRKVGDILWPQWFTARHVALAKGMGDRTWSALYQQRPSASQGSIILRQWWRPWTDCDERGKIKLPEFSLVLLAYDTAIEDGQDNDYSAMTAWGVFETKVRTPAGRETKHNNAMLIGAWRDKVKATELAGIVKDHIKALKPDLVLIEKKASGNQLVQELSALRYPVKAWLPPGPPGARGKIPRAHGVAFAFEQGSIWYVAGTKTNAVIDEVTAFPFGMHDDQVDTVTMAIAYLRRGFAINFVSDEEDAEEQWDNAVAENEMRFRGPQRRLYG